MNFQGKITLFYLVHVFHKNFNFAQNKNSGKHSCSHTRQHVETFKLLFQYQTAVVLPPAPVRGHVCAFLWPKAITFSCCCCCCFWTRMFSYLIMCVCVYVCVYPFYLFSFFLSFFFFLDTLCLFLAISGILARTLVWFVSFFLYFLKFTKLTICLK